MTSAADTVAALIRIANVTKTFGTGPAAVTALRDVSLDLERNEFFTLLGPSGCGKTTLLRLLAGFERPSAGLILLDGRDIADLPPNKRPINSVFQSYALFPHMSVAENVAFGLKRLGRRGPMLGERVAAMLRLVRLEGMAQRRPSQLSGGQQQRVALARALAPAPRLLLLDEPLSALDLKLRRGMQAELKRMQRESGVTFVLVTHDQEEALSMSDRIAVMDGGRILQTDRSTAIYARPNCRFVAEFVGEANILPGALVGLESPYAAIRPERVVVTPAPEGSGGKAGRVVDVSFLGATTSCIVALEDGARIRAQAATAIAPPLVQGQDVSCCFPADALIPLER